jgi:hypothetical protein
MLTIFQLENPKRSRRRWEDNNKMDDKNTVCEGAD